jgi:HEAT repeat protein
MLALRPTFRTARFLLPALVFALVPGRAGAVVEASAAGGGLSAVTAKVDLASRTLRYRACAQAPCAESGETQSVPITLGRDEFPDASAVKVEAIAIGEGRKVLRVIVPSKSRPVAWEALVTAAGGKGKIVYSALTGFAQGEQGEQTGNAISVLPREDGTAVVAVGTVREDLRLCNQDGLLQPSILEPKSMELRTASVQRLPRAQRDGAKRIVAGLRDGAPSDAPLGRLLVAAGASSALGKPGNLTDGNPATTWAEARSGTGLGEFVVMRASPEVPIVRFQVTVAPPGANATSGAAPKSFFLVTDSLTYAVTMPEDGWLKPGASYEIPLPEPIKTGCVALVLDEAYGRGNARPEVTLAELTAFSEFDVPGAKADALAKLLVSGGPRAQSAAAVLTRAGKAGIDAVVGAWKELDPAGRALGVDVAMSAACEDGAPLLVRAFDDGDRNVERKGREKLERCGRVAGPALVAALGDPQTAHRAKVASLLAFVAPSAALAPLAAKLGEGSPAEREAMRSAFARASRSADAPKLLALLHDPARDKAGRLELLRAMGPRAADLRADALAAIDELLSTDPVFRTRYLVLGPLAELARGGDRASLDRFAKILTKDPEWPVRAHAAELAVKIPGVQREVIAALEDREPRTREAALRTITEERLSAAAVAVEGLLLHDPWTFVRTSAAAALGSMPASPDIDSTMGGALEDSSPRVRTAIIDALGMHRAQSQSAAVRARLDEDKAPEVRVAAARALAQMCDAGALDTLTELASKVSSPVSESDEMTLGLAAIDALGKIHPPDLGRRLARVMAKEARPAVRLAAQNALAAKTICQR